MTHSQPSLFAKIPNQQGASLFVALIILLVITLLALSGVREVILESRIVGNLIEQQKLTTGAESGLRDGEINIVKPITPLEPTSTCTGGTNPPPCLLSLSNNTYSYGFLFGTSGKYRPYKPADGTQSNLNTSVNWYAMPAPSGGQDGESENPEYGSMFTGNATFRYEINSKSTNTNSNNSVYLRSTTAKLFDAGN